MSFVFVPGRAHHRLTNWADWNQVDQSTLKVDFVALFDATGNGDDETGFSHLGTVTGANLVLTEVGTVAGMSAGYRVMDGVDDEFRFTATLAATAFASAGEAWTFFLVCKNITDVAGDRFFWISDAAANNYVGLEINASDLRLSVNDAGAGVETDNSNDNMTFGSSNDTIIGVWADSTGVVRAGFIDNFTSLPTKLSDFAANDRCAVASLDGSFNGITFNAMGICSDGAAGNELACSVKYVVMDSTCLINNAA